LSVGSATDRKNQPQTHADTHGQACPWSAMEGGEAPVPLCLCTLLFTLCALPYSLCAFVPLPLCALPFSAYSRNITTSSSGPWTP